MRFSICGLAVFAALTAVDAAHSLAAEFYRLSSGISYLRLQDAGSSTHGSWPRTSLADEPLRIGPTEAGWFGG